MVSLGGVVVDDVENHFETGGMQVANHRFEIADHVAGRFDRSIAPSRGKESERVVAPIIHQPAIDQMTVIDELVDGQQFNRRYSQALQKTNRGIGSNARVGAALFFRHVGM